MKAPLLVVITIDATGEFSLMATKSATYSTRSLARTSAASKGYSAARMPGRGKSQEIEAEKNAAPSQWGRRLARLVGEKFGVHMVENHAKNEGTFKGK